MMRSVQSCTLLSFRSMVCLLKDVEGEKGFLVIVGENLA